MRVIVKEEAVKSSNSPSKAALSYYLSAHLQTCKERRETEAVRSNRGKQEKTVKIRFATKRKRKGEGEGKKSQSKQSSQKKKKKKKREKEVELEGERQWG
ncbi:MAG: hypothetical protein P4L81_08110 [Candidatus Pacebacteria bacterium]|nr:hypothetical protein [Candidatus Paceibacterota bacterium]